MGTTVDPITQVSRNAGAGSIQALKKLYFVVKTLKVE